MSRRGDWPAPPGQRRTRRELLAGLALAAPFVIAGGGALWQGKKMRRALFEGGESLSYRAHRLLAPDAMAAEFDRSQISPRFPVNGSARPEAPDYLAHAEAGFRRWTLRVGGLVERPLALSLDVLRAMPSRSQITRHDCVEGWSAIAEWTGVPLGEVLRGARLKPEARFIVFDCADVLGGLPYYESIDLNDAFHPQTILAYGMNGKPLPMGHGAPLRLRVERQLGYKHAKFVMTIRAVESLALLGLGRGGFWEDLGGYEWYAGI